MPAVTNRPKLKKIGGVWHVKTINRLIPHSNWDEAARTARIEAAKPLREIITPPQPDPLALALDVAAEEYFHLTAFVDHETAIDVLCEKHELHAGLIEAAVAEKDLHNW